MFMVSGGGGGSPSAFSKGAIQTLTRERTLHPQCLCTASCWWFCWEFARQ